ncbi:MAG TPA: ribose 5-phosphate isomerase B [Candidatus Acidoferrales bacterium]|nr:ribose 5-phosphate isomerase B [Candidatus Acidoferrales bacterium]
MLVIGCDHGGLELKNFLIGRLRARGIEVEDTGTHDADSVDYPDYARRVASKIARGEAERGILICTSGVGMSIVANKFPGVRAALVHDLWGARLSREHNDANVLVMGGAVTEKSLAEQIVTLWLETAFAGGRHQRRLDKIAEVERDLGARLPPEAK